jgi:glycosyltransferase involved in cell wall biosynthesis
MWKQESFHLDSQVKDRIHFLGHVTSEELSRIMGAAFALSYVPYFEGFGIPLVEAMRCGIPIISANTSCLPEIAGDAAIYCDPFSIEDISDKMNVLVQDQALRVQLSSNGIERANQFSWDQAAQKVWQVLTHNHSKSE